MSRTIEAIMAHVLPAAKLQPAPARIGNLVAEWQEGPTTISGYAPRKLRLVFAPSPLDAGEPSEPKPVMHSIHLPSPDAAAPAHHHPGQHAGVQREGGAHMKRYQFCTVLAVSILSLSACKKAMPPPQGPLPVNVLTVVEKQVHEWDEYTGRLDAVESVEVRPRVSGYITEVKFVAGAMVKNGDLLYVIDPRPYQADFDRAAAEFERTQAELKLAQIELDRAKDLRAKNTISASEFDQKAATHQQSSAAARSAEAAKNAAALNLEFTQVKSPIDGRVSDARITVGNLVQPGAGPESVLTTVVSVDPIYVRLDADENSLLKYVKLDEEGKRKSARNAQMPAWIQLGNETGFPHEGVVDFVDNRLDPGTGTVRARVTLRNWSSLVVPGFFARVRVAGATPYRAALIDDKVISSQQGLKYAYVVRQDNTLERRNLDTGPIFEGKRIIKKGLSGGEKVVSTRLQLLQPGMPVTPVEEKK